MGNFMKTILASLLLPCLSMHTLELSCQEETLHIYLCSRLTEAAKQWNDIISEELDAEFTLFRPQDVNLDAVSANEMDYAIYQADFNGMNQSDILLVLPPYGRNCAWEIGWFCGRQKPSIAYVEAEGDWLHDAMVKGGLTAIITSDPILYNILVNDPATSAKSYLIPSKQDLGRIIKRIGVRIGVRLDI
jgi:nucleoside 2-deoxyribosyltransferase